MSDNTPFIGFSPTWTLAEKKVRKTKEKKERKRKKIKRKQTIDLGGRLVFGVDMLEFVILLDLGEQVTVLVLLDVDVSLDLGGRLVFGVDVLEFLLAPSDISHKFVSHYDM